MATKPNATYDHLIKLVIVGDCFTGKGSLVLRFCDDAFNASTITTIGIDFKIVTVVIDNKLCRLQIIDTDGRERHRQMIENYYQSAMGIILMYNITDDQSFVNIRNWCAS